MLALTSACGGSTEDGAGGAGGSGASTGGTGGTAGSAASGGSSGAPTACEEGVTEAVTGTLANPEHPCRAWVSDNYGRTSRVGFSSGGIWSRRTPHGTALMLTAAHVLTPCWTFEPDACPEQLQDPSAVEGVGAVNLVPEGGDASLRARGQRDQLRPACSCIVKVQPSPIRHHSESLRLQRLQPRTVSSPLSPSAPPSKPRKIPRRRARITATLQAGWKPDRAVSRTPRPRHHHQLPQLRR